MSKKGIAPLIATVLLIAFAVALGAVVMNWGRAYVEDTAAIAQKSSSGQVECTNDVDFQINKIIYDEGSVLYDGNLTVVVENLKSKKIRGLSIKLIAENGDGFVTPIFDDLNKLKEDSSTTVGPFEIKTINIRELYDNVTLYESKTEAVGDVYLKEIRVIPYILPEDDYDLDIISCDGRAITTKFGEEAWPDYKIKFFT